MTPDPNVTILIRNAAASLDSMKLSWLTPASRQIVLAVGLATSYGAAAPWVVEGDIATWNWGGTLAADGAPSFTLSTGGTAYGRYTSQTAGLSDFLSQWQYPDAIKAANAGDISAVVDAMHDHGFFPSNTPAIVQTHKDVMVRNVSTVSEALNEPTIATLSPSRKSLWKPALALAAVIGGFVWVAKGTRP